MGGYRSQAQIVEDAVTTGNGRPRPPVRRWKPRPVERRILLFLGDLVAAWFAWVLANLVWMWAGEGSISLILWPRFFATRPGWFYLLPFLWLFFLVEMYDDHRATSWEITKRGLMVASLLGVLSYLVLYFYLTSVEQKYRFLPRISVAAFLLFAVVLTAAWRWFYIHVLVQRYFDRRVLVVGAGRNGRALWAWLRKATAHPYHLLGFVDDDPARQNVQIGPFRVIGRSVDLPHLVAQYAITDVFVAVQGPIRGELFQALLDLQAMGVEVSHMNAVYEELFQRVPIAHLDATWMLRDFMDASRKTVYYEAGKRLLDVLGALVGLVLLAVMTPFIALWIYLESGRPIFFRQERVGKRGERFQVWKFRTMLPDTQRERGHWAPEDQDRITPFGRFLRKTHLDEFPQFWDVLRGKMSLVGPRPEQPELVALLEEKIPFYRARLLVKPGLTGWAQVNQGYVGTLEETRTKLEYDLFYIKNRNLLFDLYIILRTFGAVLGARGE